MSHASLHHEPSNLLGGVWTPIHGSKIVSRNPARPAQVIWSGDPPLDHVELAVAAAREALPTWSRLPITRREAVLRRFAKLATERNQLIADIICDEVGKVMWEARQEASLLAAKVDITLDQSPDSGRRRVTPFNVPISRSREGRCLFRPHGVMAILGPFNFPAHLPNGHIVPALLMGNTVVFKPSDKAPGVAQALVELFDQALRDELGSPAAARGAINLVQGGADIAAALVAHPHIDGIAFTGSWPVGRKILEANLDRPGRIIALEMGGNNPAVVMPDADLRQSAIEIVRCSFNTTGQRCTSTRRAIIHKDVVGKLIPAICKAASNLIIGDPRAKHPVFMGPIINAHGRDAVFNFQREAASDADVLVPSTPLDVPGCEGGYFLTPSVIRVPRFESPVPDLPAVAGGGGWGKGGTAPERITNGKPARPAPSSHSPACNDIEVFGPLLRISVADSFDDALAQANATRFGLAASLFTRDQAAIDRFLHEAHAGCININTGTAGASSNLPFGGLGHSGNHRPAGSFALDYCAYPVASMVESSDAATVAEGMRFEADWIR